MLWREELREIALNSTINDYVSRRIMGREEVSYHIRLIVNLESDQWKFFHPGTAS